MSERTRKAYRRRILPGLAGIGSGAAALGVIAIMLVAPLGGATLIPIKKIGVSVSYSVGSAGCGKVKQFVSPHWSGSAFLTGSKVNAPKCKPGPSGDNANWDAYVNLNTPLKFKTSGSHTITVSWAVTEAATWSVTPFSGCVLKNTMAYSWCEAYTDVFVTGYAYLQDNSNYSYFYFVSGTSMSNYSTVENFSHTTCTGSSCSTSYSNFSSPTLSGSVSGSFFQNETLSATGTYAVNKNDSYTLYVTLLVIADVGAQLMDATALGLGQASATVNLGTLGNGATLAGINVT
jgi:hypothetical protein